MAIGGRHVALVALVTLLLTYAAFSGKSSSAHAKSVSVVGRKGLSEPQPESSVALLAEESTTTFEDTSEEQTSEESTDQTLEETSEESTEETSEESTDQTSEEETSDEETSDEQTSDEQTSEEVTEIVSEEVSDEPIEPSPEESTTEETSSEETTVVEDTWSQDVQAQENVELSTDASEDVAYEGRQQMREMEEVMAPQAAPPADNVAAAPSTVIKNPDRSNYPEPQDDPKVFLRDIAKDNALAKQNERLIQACIAEEGCGTPE